MLRVIPNVPSVRLHAATLIGADIVIVICTGFVVWMELMGLNLVMALIIVVLTVGEERSVVLVNVMRRFGYEHQIKDGVLGHGSSNHKEPAPLRLHQKVMISVA